jgi:hypothetical protein
LDIRDVNENKNKNPPRKVKSEIDLNQSNQKFENKEIFQTQEREKQMPTSRNSFENDQTFSVNNIVESLIQNSGSRNNNQFSSKQTRLSMESGVSFRKIPETTQEDNQNDTLERHYVNDKFNSGSIGENEPTLPNSLHDHNKKGDKEILNHPHIMTLLKNVLKDDNEILRFYKRNADHLRKFLESQKDFYYNEIIKKTYIDQELCDPCHNRITPAINKNQNYKTNYSQEISKDSLLNSTLKSKILRIENNLNYMSSHFLNASMKKCIDASNDPRTPSSQTINLNNNTTNITNLYMTTSSQNNSPNATPSGSKKRNFFKKKLDPGFQEDNEPKNSYSESIRKKKSRLYKKKGKKQFSLEDQQQFHSVQKRQKKRKNFNVENVSSETRTKSNNPVKIYKKKSSQICKS